MATLKEITAALITLKKDPQGALRGAWDLVKAEAKSSEQHGALGLDDALHLLDQVMDEVIEMATPAQPRQHRSPRTADQMAGGGSAT